MDFSTFTDIPIIDCHVHFRDCHLLADLWEIMAPAGVGRVSIVATSAGGNLNPQAICAKAQHPDRVYIFGALDYSKLLQDPPAATGADLATQVDRLIAIGVDGVKMVEGKPLYHQRMPFRFDGPVYAPFFARMEERGFPLLWHVNDPEEFWDAERLPDWIRNDWFYGDKAYPSHEEAYAEVDPALERHPGLRIFFAHFYFLYGKLERAAQLLDRHPEVQLDLTPGILGFHKLSAAPEAARDFFIEHQDRILYGVDVSVGSSREGADPVDVKAMVERIWMVRSLLESEGPFPRPGATQRWPPLQGLGLPPEVLRKIYHANFERLVGSQPRPLDLGWARIECERIADIEDPDTGRNQAREVANWLAGRERHP
jgi:predicted TIM-barrel fold metal-dependent hydrolase